MRARPAAALLDLAAPAKVNLYLHVTGRRPDGYHELDSLVVFADLGDRLTAAPAPVLALSVTGPFAAALDGGDNLVLRAARALARAAGRTDGADLRLDKRLPVAAGLGGGSADAAAALRALTALWDLPPELAVGVAPGLGADVPVCLAGRPARMTGIGERLAPVAGLPPLAAVLANPGEPLATAAVFGALAGRFGGGAGEPPPTAPEHLLAHLAGRRNDLEAPARSLSPRIGEVLALLAALPGCRLARMSGSGPTCFGLFATAAAAADGAAALSAARPGWWVRACRLDAGPDAAGT